MALNTSKYHLSHTPFKLNLQYQLKVKNKEKGFDRTVHHLPEAILPLIQARSDTKGISREI